MTNTSKRNRRPRRRVQRSRDLQMVESGFRRMRVSQPGIFSGVLPNYIKCRMDPFATSLGGSGIPDSAMTSRVVVDHRDFGTLTIGASGSCQVRLFPCLPYPLAFKASGTDYAGFSINGTSMAATTIPTSVAGSGYGWAPIISLNEWAGWMTASAATPSAEIPGPYSEVKARIVALGVKMFYTGAASTASGTITVTADRSVLGPLAQNLSATPTYNLAVAGTTNVSAFPATLDFGSVQPVLDANSITERPEVTLRVIPRRMDEAKPWLDRVQTPFITTDSSTRNSVFSFPSTSGGPLVSLYDDMWEVACITFTGVTTGAVFRFETAVCVEYQPMVSSAVNKLSKKPTQVVSIDTLSKTEQVLSRQPIAVPDISIPKIDDVVSSVAGRPPPTVAPKEQRIKGPPRQLVKTRGIIPPPPRQPVVRPPPRRRK